MTARRLALPAAIVASLVLAAVLAALAVDVLRWDRRVERADLAFTTHVGPRDLWDAETVLPSGASRALLGLRDDLAVRRAVRQFRAARPRAPIRQFSDVTPRSAAEAQLARAARTDPGARSKSLLANLRGALALEEARIAELESTVLLRRAAARFREAIRLHDGYEDAKFNLELTLRLLRSSRVQSGGGGGGDRAETPASGAGSASAGSGY